MYLSPIIMQLSVTLIHILKSMLKSTSFSQGRIYSSGYACTFHQSHVWKWLDFMSLSSGKYVWAQAVCRGSERQTPKTGRLVIVSDICNSFMSEMW